MKKVYLLLMISLFSAPVLAQSDEVIKMIKLDTVKLIIQYDFKYQEDSTDIYNIKSETMTLHVGHNQSRFVSQMKLDLDSLVKNMKSAQEFNDFMMNPVKPQMPKVNYQIYKNFAENKITHIEMIVPDSYRYKEQLDLFDWEITEESKKWQKYTLQKATTEFGGRTWEAWFASEIPISDGPYKFNGLPGLIVFLADSKNHYVYNVKTIEIPSSIKFVELSADIRFIDTDKKGFVRAYNYYKQDVLERAKSAQINDPELLQRIAENRKRKNNPIELIFE